jgi:hypothetical protein
MALLVGKHRAEERGLPLAVTLGVAAGIYLGFGLLDGRPAQLALQVAGALPFVAAAWLSAGRVGLLGIAWLAHGAWDGVHELGWVETSIPSWYAAACLGIDFAVGAAALLWARRA